MSHDPTGEEQPNRNDVPASRDNQAVDNVVSIRPKSVESSLDDVLSRLKNQQGTSSDEFLESLEPALPQPSIWHRAAVALLGAIQLVVVSPWLVGADPFGVLGDSSAAHLTRDGAVGIVIGVSALLGAWRVYWAKPAFAICAFALLAKAVANAFDSTAATGGNELVHIPSVVLSCLIATLSIRLRPFSDD